MDFNYPGYELKFIQRDRCRDASAHLETYVFKFLSPRTKYHYIIRADYHRENVFAIKFYCKKDKRSDYKYSKTINKGDLGNIVISCLKVIPVLLQDFEDASFGFIGSRSYDSKGLVFEPIAMNQRFRIWSEIVKKKIGMATFTHLEFPEISGYLLLNKRSLISEPQKLSFIKRMFLETYNEFPDLLT